MSSAATTETQLVTIPDGTALSVFTTDQAIDPFLARIRAEVDAFVPDLTTATGRKAIASIAYKVAQTKTYLESVGKALADEQKEIPKKIDACRKRVRDTLDLWRDEVRQPLTDWETAEEARIKAHTDTLTALNEICRMVPGRDSAALRESLAAVEAVFVAPHLCDEFEADYARAKEAARTALTEELPKAEKREAEAAELIRLRAEAETRAQADRDDAIRREAAQEATMKTEAEAQAKIDAETAAAATARAEAAAALQAAADTEARLKREADDKAAADAAETARREADVQHRSTINRTAAAAFVAGGMTEEAAKLAVSLIAKKAIPAIVISY